MARLAILIYPDPRLRNRALPVEQVDDSVRQLAADMAETMYEAKGVGLAATQVGVDRRVVVIDCDPGGENSQLLTLINPEILDRQGASYEEEGCLSVPGYVAHVRRAERVKARWLDLDGRQQEIETDGLLAIALQHEIDHLDGRLFIDRLSPLKRELFKKRYQKQQETATA